ncbi:helix-turn-helix domain-containing protein [Robertmurraya sp. Marseille-Q9965]
MEYPIGELLKTFREYKNLSIQELSDGICSENELVSFEKDDAYPTIEILHKLGKRLNIELSYFFDVASRSTINYSTAVIQIVEKYKRERDYKTIYNIIHQEKENPLFQIGQYKQYLTWHEGICKYYIDQDLDSAIRILYDSIEITNPKRINLNERETEILNSIALLHYENQDFLNALKIFSEALTNIDKIPYVFNTKVKIRILFGLSQVYTELGEYEESIKYCQNGINLCINSDSLYGLNELHYQMGENYIKLGEVEKGEEYIDECLHLLKLEKKYHLIEIIQQERDKLLSK